jgi:hypothetical protein
MEHILTKRGELEQYARTQLEECAIHLHAAITALNQLATEMADPQERLKQRYERWKEFSAKIMAESEPATWKDEAA